jgi:hypothetical protein
LASDKTENGPVEITADVEEVIDSSGSYSFEGGGGVYIVENELFAFDEDDSAPFSFEDDEDDEIEK